MFGSDFNRKHIVMRDPEKWENVSHGGLGGSVCLCVCAGQNDTCSHMRWPHLINVWILPSTANTENDI